MRKFLSVAAVPLCLGAVAGVLAGSLPADAAGQPREPSGLACTVIVSDQRPADGSAVAVAVRVTSNARVTVTALYKTARTTATAVASGDLALVAYDIGSAKPGYEVAVGAVVSLGKLKGSCSSWFIPQDSKPHSV
jgi:hypothetical protein